MIEVPDTTSFGTTESQDAANAAYIAVDSTLVLSPDLTNTQESHDEPIKFCLLAEFDIDQGATLTHQYPYPTGTDEHTLAELMLPDGAHMRGEDWTIFYLNQTRKNKTNPVLAHESPARKAAGEESSSEEAQGTSAEKEDLGELLFVLNCVRMKEDKSVRRGAMVKALAVCTNKPYIQIYKPLLILALEDYFKSPSPEILSRLFDALNGISTTGCPSLSRSEKRILRDSERRDLFEERFEQSNPQISTSEEGEVILDATEDLDRPDSLDAISPDNNDILGQEPSSALASQGSSAAPNRTFRDRLIRLSDGSVRRLRKSSRQSMRETAAFVGSHTNGGDRTALSESPSSRKSAPGIRDTHFFDTFARYNDVNIPIRIPLATLPEEIGDYSLSALIRKLSANTQPFSPPYHPHLHSSGAQTHPIILLINAVLTQKRIIFLGYGQPAALVANAVLACCGLTGHVVQGIAERAFPYANLAALEIMEEVPGYIAGVTNPRFEDLTSTWDVLCNLETGKITVSKDVSSLPASEVTTVNSIASSQSGEVTTFRSDDGHTFAPPGRPSDNLIYKGETFDGMFMEEDGKPGSGITFPDENTKLKEFKLNAGRIDGWRRTKSYGLWQAHFVEASRSSTSEPIDIGYQIARLRNGKDVTDAEAEAIYYNLAARLDSYDQITELLCHLPSHYAGLMPLAFGLFHRLPSVRHAAFQVINRLRSYQIGEAFVSALNPFQKLTFERLLRERMQ